VIYLLDTDHITFLQEHSSPEYAVLALRMSQHRLEDFGCSVVNLHEQTLGANNFVNKAKTTAEIIRGYEIFSEILETYGILEVLPFDVRATAVFATLKLAKIRVGTMDLRLAAIALSRGLILLTRNKKDFSKVPGLVIEDWTV
jgi:tRNA(fMet)-specific endonuclease VapC